MWTEKHLDVQADGIVFHEVGLRGSWPDTKLHVTCEHAGGVRQVDLPIWAEDGSEMQDAVQLAGDLLQGIYEGAVGRPPP